MIGLVTGLVIGIVGLTGFVMGTGLTEGMVTGVAGDEVSGGMVTVAGVVTGFVIGVAVTGFVIGGAVTGLVMGVVG